MRETCRDIERTTADGRDDLIACGPHATQRCAPCSTPPTLRLTTACVVYLQVQRPEGGVVFTKPELQRYTWLFTMVDR